MNTMIIMYAGVFVEKNKSSNKFESSVYAIAPSKPNAILTAKPYFNLWR